MSSLWLVVLELISLAGEKGSLGEGTLKWVTELGCSRGDLPSLKEEDRVDRQRSWGWLVLEVMELLADLLSGQKQEQDATYPGTSSPPYGFTPACPHTMSLFSPGISLPLQVDIFLNPSTTMNPTAEIKGKVFPRSILSFPAHPRYLKGQRRLESGGWRWTQSSAAAHSLQLGCTGIQEGQSGSDSWSLEVDHHSSW